MQQFDAIVAGAGPAGGQCARELVQKGMKTLLIDRANSFAINNYSSGGAPLSIMENFRLPKQLVGSYWNKLTIKTASESFTWCGEEAKGVILDFMKLRQFLAEEAVSNGSELKLHHSFVNYQEISNGVTVNIRNLDTKSVETYTAKYLVDATGCERQVIGSGETNRKTLMPTGVEYLVEVDPQTYTTFDNTLTFYFGPYWMPHGYGWIFPMGSNQLKVGVIQYFKNNRQPLRHYLDALIDRQIGMHKVLDKHGKTLDYRYGRKDKHFQNNIIAIGDAVSTLNPLACEGIRHAMASGHFAAKALLSDGNFEEYRKELAKYCGWGWYLSELLMSRFYQQSDDKQFDLFLKTLKKMSFEELLDTGFGYRFMKTAYLYMQYSLKSLF